MRWLLLKDLQILRRPSIHTVEVAYSILGFPAMAEASHEHSSASIRRYEDWLCHLPGGHAQ